jgi:hypothetical protein
MAGRRTRKPLIVSSFPNSRSLFIVPTRRGDGFRANVRGRILELEDPSDHRFAPTPTDLVILSIASDLAWFARRFLHGHGEAADVSVAAAWQAVDDPPRLTDLEISVTLPSTTETTGDALQSALEERAAAHSFDGPPRVRVGNPA